MNRFQNEIVMGGSDIDSESEDEYITGPEIYDQYMYNAMMYTSMAQMMPCVPMPYVPPFGYPVPCPLPYPPMINEFPVNHAMAAGAYYRKGGRQHRSGRNKTRSRLHIERDDDVKYKPRHKQHLVQRHQYYTSSTESDNDEKCPDTRGKAAPACRPVCHDFIADKCDTLRHSNPTSNTGQRRLQNDKLIADVTPLPSTLHHSRSVKKEEVDIAAQVPLCRNSRNNVTAMHKNDQSNIRTDSAPPNITSFENKALIGTAAISNQMPLNSLHSQNAVTAVIVCHQGEPTTPDEPDVVIAVNNTKPLGHQSKVFVTETSDSLLGVDSNQSTTKQLTALPSQYAISSNSNQMTHDAACDKMSSYDESLPGIADATRDSKPKDGSQLNMSAVHTDSDKSGVVETHVSTKLGRVISSPESLQLHSNTTVQALGSEQDGSTSGHQQDPAQVLDWRNTTNSQKCLQSLHSLRKIWAEWETKYRPPPVSVHTDRGAGPQNLYPSIS